MCVRVCICIRKPSCVVCVFMCVDVRSYMQVSPGKSVGGWLVYYANWHGRVRMEYFGEDGRRELRQERERGHTMDSDATVGQSGRFTLFRRVVDFMPVNEARGTDVRMRSHVFVFPCPFLRACWLVRLTMRLSDSQQRVRKSRSTVRLFLACLLVYFPSIFAFQASRMRLSCC